MKNLDDMNKSLDDIILKLEEILELQDKAIKNNIVLQTRAAELQRAPVQSEQKCPLCKGRGWLRGQGDMFKCYHCNGTGISTRSDGG